MYLIILAAWLLMALGVLAIWCWRHSKKRAADLRRVRLRRIYELCQNEIVVAGGDDGLKLAQAHSMMRPEVVSAGEWDKVEPTARA